MGVILAYLGFSGITRIPMTLFEISFLGAEFTLVRYLTAPDSADYSADGFDLAPRADGGVMATWRVSW